MLVQNLNVFKYNDVIGETDFDFNTVPAMMLEQL